MSERRAAPDPPPRQPRPLRREVARPFTYGPCDDEAPRNALYCPESVSGHDVGRDGRCVWCERRVDPPVGAPVRFGPTGLDQEYRRHYDPDWGTDYRDV